MATGQITAVLGPTNTGKTHYALERMLAHRSGVIGLPLRLLAREVYDRIVALRGPSVVALVTGEERIVPQRAQYWVATVEAMPEVMPDFLAVDEIQLCADPERGHVFTDRLLNARGRLETLFLGAETMRPAIAALIPRVQFLRRERFSALTWAGAKKLSRLPARSAIVGFSVDAVYEIAELMRRRKGGVAVVMGALSPRTRNAQVALYQNGDVDYLVATDAIGMGLNLDIAHVAFSSTVKFDGHRTRPLWPHELAQIAGRAGRHLAPGTFGVTAGAGPLAAEVIAQIEASRFAPLRRLVWRNPRPDTGSLPRLIASLEEGPSDPWLARAREGEDLAALRALAALPEVVQAAASPARVELLWQVCRIPDYRGISPGEHAALLGRIFGFLTGPGRVPEDWLAAQVLRLDRSEGNIDVLSKRLAHIRTWTYVAQRGWVENETHWRGETRRVEDRLSDALHARLTQRFVDRRTSVLLRRLKDKESLLAEVNESGEVTVEGEHAGRLEGFRFRIDRTGSPDEARTLRQAAAVALKPVFSLKADRCYNAPDTEFDLTEQGGLMWGVEALGKLVKGSEPLRPGIEVFVDEEAGPELAGKVQRRLQHFVDRRIAALFAPLIALQGDAALEGLARGFAFRLGEGFGILPRAGVAAEVKALDQEARAALRRHGVRFGQYTVFLPALLKPAPTRLRLVLWALWQGLEEFPESPPPGLVTIPAPAGQPTGAWAMAGYHPAGSRAIRIDMLERLADQIRARDSRSGFEAQPDMLSITGLTLEQFAELMQGLGYVAERGERPKQRAVPEAIAAGVEDAAGAAPDAPAAPESGEGAPTSTVSEASVAVAGPDETPDPASDGRAATAEAAEADGQAADAPTDAGHVRPTVRETQPAPSATAAPSGPANGSTAEAVEATGSPAGSAQPSAAAGAEVASAEVPDSAAAEADTEAAVASGSAVAQDAGPVAGPSPADLSGAGAGSVGGMDAPSTDAGVQEGSTGASVEPANETEVFYTFTWRPRGRGQRRHHGDAQRHGGEDDGRSAQGRRRRGVKRDGATARGTPGAAAAGAGEVAPADGARPGGAGRPGHARSKPGGNAGGKGGGSKPARAGRQAAGHERAPRSFEARPPRVERGPDPDSPFAILAALKDKG